MCPYVSTLDRTIPTADVYLHCWCFALSEVDASYFMCIISTPVFCRTLYRPIQSIKQFHFIFFDTFHCRLCERAFSIVSKYKASKVDVDNRIITFISWWDVVGFMCFGLNHWWWACARVTDYLRGWTVDHLAVNKK